MTKQTLKVILLEALDAAEIALEKDVKRDEQSKMYVQYLLYFFKSVGIDTVEKLALQGGEYIKGQVQLGIELSVAKVSLAVSTLLNLIVGFLIVSVGLVFGAIALSLFLGELFGSNALGFVASGVLWIVLMLSVLKIFFNKRRVESLISNKMKLP